MEHHVVLEKLCSCAKRHAVDRIRSFESREEAEEHAHEWAENLNHTLCGKHGFDIVEVDADFQGTSLPKRSSWFVISVEEGGFVEACEL